MTRTRKDQRRDQHERAVDRRLAQLAKNPSRAPWLPMPWTTGAILSYAELYEYRRRQALHRAEHPAYEAGWHRPTLQTADDVWQALGLVGVNRFLPRFALTDEEKDTAGLVVRQVTVVILDTIVRAGRRDQPHGQPRDRRLLTRNAIFDALAGHWSDHYRQARDEGRAVQVRDMTTDTATASWRDLVRVGVPLSKLWRFVQGLTGLYTLKRVNRVVGDTIQTLGYAVTLHKGPRLEDFERLVHDDPDYCPRWRNDEKHVLFDGDPMPPRRLRQEICAERAYNVVPLGPRSERLLDTLGQTRLVFDTEDFLRDYAEPPDQDWLAQYRRIFEQVREGVPECVDDTGTRRPGCALIKSRFFRARNGRWQPRHFWPMETRGKRTRRVESTIQTPFGEHREIRHESERLRWFPSVSEGFDVSASQAQILAVFLGNDALEALASDRRVPFKQYLAQLTWKLFAPAGYKGADDKRLVALVKWLWTRVLYGSRVGQIIYEVRRDPKDQYGPGLAPRTADFRADCQANEARAEEFLRAVPGYVGERSVSTFLNACRHLAWETSRADPYDGVWFVDPYDGVEFRWNPVQRAPCRLAFEQFELYVSLPGREHRRRFHGNMPNAAGDFPVDRDDLRDMVAPCLVHRLDAFFAGLVIERLAAHGVSDVVSLHDCWLVPAGALPALEVAIADAGQEWLRGLGPVYDRLLHYLGDDPDYGPFVREIRDQWVERVRQERWPQFSVKRDVLWELEDSYGDRLSEEEIIDRAEDYILWRAQSRDFFDPDEDEPEDS
jgi:hypothetical protein